MKKLAGQPLLYILLLPFFFVWHGFQRFYEWLEWKDVWPSACIYLAFSLIIYGLACIFIRNRKAAGVLVVLLLIPFFFWGNIQDPIKKVSGDSFFAKTSFLLPACGIIAYLIYIFFKKQHELRQQRLTIFINLLFIIYIATDVCIIVAKPGIKTMKQQRAEAFKQGAARDWCVYFIILDEYASTESLKNNLGFDNSATDAFLENQGFRVLKNSHSNYSNTSYSMASILGMEYPQTRGNEMGIRAYNEAAQLVKNAKGLKLFTDVGYQLINHSIFDLPNAPSDIEETFLPIKSRLINANTLYERIIKFQLMKLGIGRQDRFMSEQGFYKYYHYNEKTLAAIKQEAQVTDRRTFVYAHLMTPHIPYYFDSTGQMEKPAVAMDRSHQLDPKYYLYNLRYANKELIKLVNTLMKYHSNDAAIVIMGDHGFKRKMNVQHDSVLFQNLAAVYFPDRDYSSFQDDFSSVNMLRMVSNKVLRTDYSLLHDTMIVMHDEIDD